MNHKKQFYFIQRGVRPLKLKNRVIEGVKISYIKNTQYIMTVWKLFFLELELLFSLKVAINNLEYQEISGIIFIDNLRRFIWHFFSRS